MTHRLVALWRHPRLWRWLWLPLSYALLLVPFFGATFGEWSSALATRCVDRCDTGWQNVWSLWWVADSIRHGRWPGFTQEMFYPGGVDLFWQTLMLANGIVMTPITLVFGPIVAFNTLTFLTFVVAAWSMALLADAMVKHRFGAWLAGALYTFAPFHVWLSYSGFVERLSIQYFPILLFALWKIGQSPRWWPAILAALAVLASFFSSLYYGLFSITYVAVWSMVMTFVYRQQRDQLVRLWQRVVAMGALVAAPVLPFAVQILLPGKLPPSQSGAVLLDDYLLRQVDFSASLMTFVTPSIVHPLWGEAVVTWYRQYSPTHWPISIGFVLVVMSIWGLRVWRTTTLPRWWLVMTAVVIVFSMGPRVVWLTRDMGIPLPYDLLNNIPLVKLGQRPNHFLLLAMAHLAVLTAVAIREGVARLPYPRVGMGVVALVAVVELWPMPLQPFRPTQSEAYTLIERGQSGAVLTIPFDLDDGNTMYGQWFYDRPVLSGYLPRLNPELANIGLLQQTDGVMQFTAPLTTTSVLHQDSVQALPDMMRALDIEYVIYDKRFGVLVNREVLAALEPVAADEVLELYRRPGGVAPAPWVVLNYGWYPKERDQAGRWWQWGNQASTFWVYQTPDTTAATIITARMAVPAPMRVTFDGVTQSQALLIAIDEPNMVRTYRFLAQTTKPAVEYWFTVDALYQTNDRAVGILLEMLTATPTTWRGR
ncbi:MAG: hypothetical protein ACK5GU_04725 [Chloroflexota bacterium]|jgi:hypothetical protein